MRDESILILKTGEALAPVKRRSGDFEDWILRGLGISADSIQLASVYRGDALPPVESIRGVVVTGSPAMVTDRPDWSEDSAQWLAKIVEADSIPVLGLCYGHQLMAHGLGGQVGPNPNGREMGSIDVMFHDDAAESGSQGEALGPIFEAGVHRGHMSHVESVLRPPSDSQILAHTALDPYSVLCFGPRQWGVQFHPEFDREIMQGYLEARREILIEEGLDPDAMIAEAVETVSITRVLARFTACVDAA